MKGKGLVADGLLPADCASFTSYLPPQPMSSSSAAAVPRVHQPRLNPYSSIPTPTRPRQSLLGKKIAVVDEMRATAKMKQDRAQRERAEAAAELKALQIAKCRVDEELGRARGAAGAAEARATEAEAAHDRLVGSPDCCDRKGARSGWRLCLGCWGLE